MISWQRTESPLWLLIYDIPDPRRLQKIARVATQYRVRGQQSVYGFSLSESKLHGLVQALQERIDKRMDRVRLFHMPEGTKLGSNAPTLLSDGFFWVGDLESKTKLSEPPD